MEANGCFMLPHAIWWLRWLERNNRIFCGAQLNHLDWKKRVFGLVIEWSAFSLDHDVMTDVVIAMWLEALVML